MNRGRSSGRNSRVYIVSNGWRDSLKDSGRDNGINNVSFSRRLDLENTMDTCIWLDLKYKNGRRLTVANSYREFMQARQNYLISGTSKAQIDRWTRTVNT